jgi:hypothetical protein
VSEPGWITFRSGEEAAPSATLTRWADSPWPRLVRGQRVKVSLDARQWRVTGVDAHPDGSETYALELAEVVDARIAGERRT